MSRRTIILLGALAGAILLALLAGPGGGAPDGAERGTRADAGRRSPARQERGTADGEPVRQVVELHSVSVDDVPSEYEPGRDPFRFYEPPKPAPPPPEPKPEPRPERPPVEPPPEPEPQGPRPPPIELEYLGSFGPADQPIAVFTDGEEILNARLGDVLDGSFRVVRIGYESVDLAFVDFPEVPAERLPIGRPNGG